MKTDEIIEAVRLNNVNITLHAGKEAKEDALKMDDIFFSVCYGQIIEDYPDDFPYPGWLIYGKMPSGDPVHSVWAYDSESRIAVLITTYRPDPERWIDWKERKKT